MQSASIVLQAVSCWIAVLHSRGQFPKRIIQPVCDLAVVPQKSAPVQARNGQSLRGAEDGSVVDGSRKIPDNSLHSSCVGFLGFKEKRVTWLTAYAMSGLVLDDK